MGKGYQTMYCNYTFSARVSKSKVLLFFRSQRFGETSSLGWLLVHLLLDSGERWSGHAATANSFVVGWCARTTQCERLRALLCPYGTGPGSCLFGPWNRFGVGGTFSHFFGGDGKRSFLSIVYMYEYASKSPNLLIYTYILQHLAHNLRKVSTEETYLPQDLDATAAGAALHWANAARVAATSFLWWTFLRWVANGTSW